ALLLREAEVFLERPHSLRPAGCPGIRVQNDHTLAVGCPVIVRVPKPFVERVTDRLLVRMVVPRLAEDIGKPRFHRIARKPPVATKLKVEDKALLGSGLSTLLVERFQCGPDSLPTHGSLGLQPGKDRRPLLLVEGPGIAAGDAQVVEL